MAIVVSPLSLLVIALCARPVNPFSLSPPSSVVSRPVCLFLLSLHAHCLFLYHLMFTIHSFLSLHIPVLICSDHLLTVSRHVCLLSHSSYSLQINCWGVLHVVTNGTKQCSFSMKSCRPSEVSRSIFISCPPCIHSSIIQSPSTPNIPLLPFSISLSHFRLIAP